MQKTQKLSVQRILERENLSISKLAENLEINRTYISQLLNHNKKLSDKDWKKIVDAYPEHLISGEVILKPKRITKSESEELFKKPAKEIKKKKEETIQQIPTDKIKPEQIIVESEIKTKPELRHKNLNCPHCDFHMKVKAKHLAIARPLCPIDSIPMLTKEEWDKLLSFSDNQAASAKFLIELKPIKLF
jgi:YesN/AraC family two-component response regulator